MYILQGLVDVNGFSGRVEIGADRVLIQPAEVMNNLFESLLLQALIGYNDYSAVTILARLSGHHIETSCNESKGLAGSGLPVCKDPARHHRIAFAETFTSHISAELILVYRHHTA